MSEEVRKVELLTAEEIENWKRSQRCSAEPHRQNPETIDRAIATLEALMAERSACIEALNALISFGGANTDTACEELRRILPEPVLDELGGLPF